MMLLSFDNSKQEEKVQNSKPKEGLANLVWGAELKGHNIENKKTNMKQGLSQPPHSLQEIHPVLNFTKRKRK